MREKLAACGRGIASLRRLAALFHALPALLRRLAAFARELYGALRGLRCGVWVLNGPGKHGGGTLTAAFAGSEGFKADLAQRVFAQPGREEALGTHWRWRVQAAARRAAPGVELLFIEVPGAHERLFRPSAFLILPAWVRMEVSLTEQAGAKPSLRFREVRALVRRRGLTVTFTRDPAR